MLNGLEKATEQPIVDKVNTDSHFFITQSAENENGETVVSLKRASISSLIDAFRELGIVEATKIAEDAAQEAADAVTVDVENIVKEEVLSQKDSIVEDVLEALPDGDEVSY